MFRTRHDPSKIIKIIKTETQKCSLRIDFFFFWHCVAFTLVLLPCYLYLCKVCGSFTAVNWILPCTKHSHNCYSLNFPPKEIWHTKPSHNLVPLPLSFSQKGIKDFSWCCILLIPILVRLVCIRRTNLILHLEMIWSCSNRGPQTRADFPPKGIWHIKLSRNLCPPLLSFSPKGILSPLLLNAMSFKRQWGRTDQSGALANPPPSPFTAPSTSPPAPFKRGLEHPCVGLWDGAEIGIGRGGFWKGGVGGGGQGDGGDIWLKTLLTLLAPRSSAAGLFGSVCMGRQGAVRFEKTGVWETAQWWRLPYPRAQLGARGIGVGDWRRVSDGAQAGGPDSGLCGGRVIRREQRRPARTQRPPFICPTPAGGGTDVTQASLK